MKLPELSSFPTAGRLWFALSFILSPALAANNPGDFYTRIGTDPSFQELVDNGTIVPGERFHPGPVLGSTIDVNNTLLEQQTGPQGPIAQDIRIHTQKNGSIQRGAFPNWTRWYQEDGNVQVMRLFEGEQNVRGGIGEDGSPGRIEAFFPPFAVEPGTWSVWEGTFTIIDPIGCNIFQLFHEGGQLWAFHLRMTSTGRIFFSRRRAIEGLPSEITIATNMVGRPISIRVLANGFDYKVFKKIPGEDADWVLVTTGHYTQAEDNRVSFRWGMYIGSQAGQTVSKDAMLFVSGAHRSVLEPVSYYWDGNGTTAGFGNAQGVWSVPTAGSATQGWSTSEAGTLLPGEVTTTTDDRLFFGTDASGLGTGTITVSGTVSAGDLIFGGASGNITLSGGEILMSGNRLISLRGEGTTQTITSVLGGSGSRTIGGEQAILALTGLNTFTGPLIVGDETANNLRLQINSIANTNGTPSAAGAPTSFSEGIIQLGAGSRRSILELVDSTAPQATNRRIRLGSDGAGNGSGSIWNSNADPAYTLTFTNSTFNVAATGTGSSNRTLNLGGSNTGDNVIQGAIIDNEGTSGGQVALAKFGSGTWVLAGTNTYTGATTINNGTLRIGNGGATGALSPESTITNNSILEFRRSNTTTQGTHFSGNAITGSGSIVQSGSGIVVFNTVNTYSGLTTINAGALRISHGGALGSTDAGTVVNGSTPSGGPRLELAGGITVTGESLTLSGGGNFRGALSSQSGNNEWAGPITIAAPETRIGTSDTATLHISGVIDSGGEPHGLTVRAGPVESSSVILSAANTYFGDTTLLIGRLVLEGGDNRLPVGTRLITGNFGDANEFDLNGRSQEVAGLGLRENVTIPSNNIITNSSATLSTLTVSTPHGSPSVYGGTLQGNLALIKTGPETLTLTHSHTFNGPTAVNAGTLALFGAVMASPITVAAGASLALSTDAPATSSSSVNLGGGTVRILGPVDNASDYLLFTANGGITGTPTLHAPIPGYELEVRDNGTRLFLAHVSADSGFAAWSGGAAPDVDSSNDGLPNAIAWALGAASPFDNVRALLPQLDHTSDPAYLLFVFPRSNTAATDPGTQIDVEFGTDLADWNPAIHDGENVIMDVVEGDPVSTVVVRFKHTTLAPNGILFARLRVTVATP